MIGPLFVLGFRICWSLLAANRAAEAEVGQGKSTLGLLGGMLGEWVLELPEDEATLAGLDTLDRVLGGFMGLGVPGG